MNLHQEFRKTAFDIFNMRKKLISLLLEIYQKEIYKEHDCSTIYEYAYRYAKLSRERVQKALRTLRNTEDLPALRAEIETSGLDKVAMVVKLATPETEHFFVEHVKNMPTPVLQAYAKEVRHGKCVTPKMTIELDEEMQILFNQLKKKLAPNASNQQALKTILKNVFEDGILKTSQLNTTRKSSPTKQPSDAPSLPARNIPIQKKREIEEKTQGKCSYPHCTKPIENYHHTVPFAFDRSHNSVVGLCKTHHEFCHQGVILNELQPTENWKLSLEPNRSIYDNLYLKYKSKPRILNPQKTA